MLLARDLSLREYRRVRATLDALYAEECRAFIAANEPALREADAKRAAIRRHLLPQQERIKLLQKQRVVNAVYLELRSQVDRLEKEYDALSEVYWSLRARVTAARNWLEINEPLLKAG